MVMLLISFCLTVKYHITFCFLQESLHPAGRREGELYYSLKSLEIVKF